LTTSVWPTVRCMRANNFKDIKDKTFGRLKVTEFSHTQDKKSYWFTKCACGNTKLVRGGDLSSGKTKSCGCLKSQSTVDFNHRTKTKIALDTFSVVWQSYKRGAKNRDLDFHISKDEFYTLTQQNCTYCNQPPSQERKPRVKGKLNSFIYNGIDRIDSKKGYTLDNCTACCKLCNMMKRNLSVAEFVVHIKRIHAYQKGRWNKVVP
jgi:hypothetical protein